MEKRCSGKMQCSVVHGELTMHAWVNKCTGVTADHVKKHLGAVCACIYAGMLTCVHAFVCESPHPHDHHKIESSPSYASYM